MSTGGMAVGARASALTDGINKANKTNRRTAGSKCLDFIIVSFLHFQMDFSLTGCCPRVGKLDLMRLGSSMSQTQAGHSCPGAAHHPISTWLSLFALAVR